MGEVLDLKRKHGRAMDRMARRRRAARLSFLAGAGKFLLKGGGIGAGLIAGLGIKPVANAEMRQDVAMPSQAEIDNMHSDDTNFTEALAEVEAAKRQGGLPTPEYLA